jgi:undecaprenyl-diphosphatase
MPSWLRNARDFVSRRRESTVLITALILVLALWGLIALTDEVLEGGTQRFDERIMKSLRHPDDLSKPIGPPWMLSMVRDVTALGSFVVLTLVVSAVAGFLIIIRRYNMTLLVLAASAGGASINSIFKHFIDRPRPRIVPHLTDVSSASFPSGHSALSASVYLTLGGLLASNVRSRRLKAYFLFVAILVTVMVGASRVYLGVHYPSDVLAGWTTGLIWAIIVWFLGRHLQRRGAVEPETDSIPTLDPKP